jgi:hypothetical protein
LERFTLAKDLKRISSWRILEARLAAENQRVQDSLKEILHQISLERALEALRQRCEKLKEGLHRWEHAASDYRALLCIRMADGSKRVREMAFGNMEEARLRFKKAYAEWNDLIRRHPLELKKFLLGPVPV